MVEQAQTSAKAVAAFVVLIVTNLLVNLGASQTSVDDIGDAVSGAVPMTGGEWIAMILTTLAGTYTVWRTSNHPKTV